MLASELQNRSMAAGVQSVPKDGIFDEFLITGQHEQLTR